MGSSPEGACLSRRPLQGSNHFPFVVTQGFALGYRSHPFGARRVKPSVGGSRFKAVVLGFV
jgi:hypothetical protein